MTDEHDHNSTHPRDSLGHLMSASFGLCLNSLGVACRSFFYPDPPCHLTNLPWVRGLGMGFGAAGLFSIFDRNVSSWCMMIIVFPLFFDRHLRRQVPTRFPRTSDSAGLLSSNNSDIVPTPWELRRNVVGLGLSLPSTVKGRCLQPFLRSSRCSMIAARALSFAVDQSRRFEHLRSLFGPIRALPWTLCFQARIGSNYIRSSFELSVFKGHPSTYCVYPHSSIFPPWVPCNPFATCFQCLAHCGIRR